MNRISPMAIAIALAFPWASTAQVAAPGAPAASSASPPAVQLDAVIVTANPLGSSLFDLVPPASVLEGDGLTFRKRSTLGETLNEMPGVSSSYFGPNASRPVIRGLDADRIRIMQNGTGMLDASALSFDHAVAIDPMMIDRVEVVRGPAALLYGGNAVGGVVNVIDNRIAREPLDGVAGGAEIRYGGAEDERGGGARLEAGNGQFVLHADAYSRRTGNLSIRGPAVSDRLRELSASGARNVQQALLDARSRLPNSDSRSSGGGLGATLFWAKGSAGMSYSGFDTDYGTVAEPTVRVDMQSTRWDAAGELHDLDGVFSGFKAKWGRTDYKHVELDAGVPGTTFRNAGNEVRLEALHRPIGGLTGSIGVQAGRSDFSALGDEAFVPPTRSTSRALFIYEELPLGKFKLNVGGRVERAQVSSDGGGNIPTGAVDPRFGAAQTRSFSASSAGLGALYTLSQSMVVAVNLASTGRAPTSTELFANGPHAATGSYEVGNTAFEVERSRSIDLSLRMRSGPNSGTIGIFHTRFNNFITEFTTGANRAADGETSPVDAGGGETAAGFEILPEVAFRAVPAVFKGVEAQGRYRLFDRGSTVDLELRADYTDARNADTGVPLPRIAPLRLGAGLVYAREAFGARVDVSRVRSQTRVAANELPTDGYTLLNASASYRLKSGRTTWEAFLRANNLLNANARNHVSFLKDQAPLPGRGLMLGLRAGF
jgi:iron complex outermembrane receptor protein